MQDAVGFGAIPEDVCLRAARFLPVALLESVGPLFHHRGLPLDSTSAAASRTKSSQILLAGEEAIGRGRSNAQFGTYLTPSRRPT